MASNDNKAPGSGHPEQEVRRLRRRSTDIFTEMAQREDVRSFVDGDWHKKSRDDVPPSNRPMPENPLINLRPHKPTGRDRNDNSQSQRRSDD